MDEIIKQVRFLFFCVLAFFAVLYILQIIDLTTSIFVKTYGVSPWFGYFSLATMLSVYVAIIYIPLSFILRLPKTLKSPKDEKSQEYQVYLNKLRSRLLKNKHLESFPLVNNSDLHRAYEILDQKSNEEIKSIAMTVFISTGVSQNGKLDGLLLVSAQIQLIWRVALIYNQRPDIRDIFKIYTYVFSNAFLASSIEDLDINEQIQPVINAAMADTALASIPFAQGLSNLTSIVTESIIDGAANSYLTLRLGKIASYYFNPFKSNVDADVSKQARNDALFMLVDVVKEGANIIRVAIWGAAKQTASTATSALVEVSIQAVDVVGSASKKAVDTTLDVSKQAASTIGNAASKTVSSVGDVSKKVADFVKDAVGKRNNDEPSP